MPHRLRVLASHPVQYHVPYYRALIAAGIDLAVGYFHPGTAAGVAYDRGFGRAFRWDVDLLSGVPHHFFSQTSGDYSRRAQMRAAPALLRWALAERRTPLLLVGWFAPLAYAAWLARTGLRMPTLLFTETTPRTWARQPKPRWRAALTSGLCRRAAACLAIGTENARFYKERGVAPQRIFRTPYSIDNERFAARAATLRHERHALCTQYGLDPALPTFVFCGKFEPVKRPLLLLEAYLAAGLAEKAQLVYVGDGALRPALAARIEAAGAKNVHLIGFLNQSEMPAAYVLGEVLCLVSEAETWGLVVNEALACGRPVIGTRAGAVPELVDESVGQLAVPHDAASFADAIASLYDRDTEALGRAARERALRYSWGHTFQAQLNTYVTLGARLALPLATARPPHATSA